MIKIFVVSISGNASEYQSGCDETGKWSEVLLECHKMSFSFNFGEDLGKDFLIIILVCIFLILISVSTAIAFRLIIKRFVFFWFLWDTRNHRHFQSRDLEDRETQEATMSVCMCLLSVSQKIIRFKSMNSSVNSFLEWQ